MPQDWEERCAKQRAARDATIPKEWLLKDPPSDDVTNVMSVPYTCGIMTERELALTELDATELLARLAKGEISSYELTLAFCKRAAIAQQLLNCLMFMFVDEALDRAKELDETLKKTGKVVGPYHGLPFSIKDQWAIKGKESVAAVVSSIGHVDDSDAYIVRVLRESGAVFFCKTTQPQTGMQLETVSNVYGRTLNPFNRNLTCGGSSGGEGALVAFRGSPIGLAADIGGSIRSPAANNGLFGAKITSGRIPLNGIFHPLRGFDAVPLVAGPVCRSARDNEHFIKVMLATEPWRTTHMPVPLPWREDVVLPKKISIGFIWDDGVVKPHPPITAGLKSLKAKLQALPHLFDVVDWEPFDHARGYDVVRKLYWLDGGKLMMDTMTESGEPVLPLTQWVMKESHAKERTAVEIYDLNLEREMYRAAYQSHWNKHPKVDFLLSPVGPGVAPRHDTARYWGYTAIFNLLDYPAFVFPTGETSSAKLHPKETSYKPRDNEFDAENWSSYKPEECEGAPISFQLVGRKWDDERVVNAVLRVSEALGLKDAGSLKG